MCLCSYLKLGHPVADNFPPKPGVLDATRLMVPRTFTLPRIRILSLSASTIDCNFGPILAFEALEIENPR